MKRYYLGIALLIIFSQVATAQYYLKEVTQLGKFSIRNIKYYDDTKEWVVSDGYLVFKLWNNFNEAKLLFNTFPKYQFELDRLPNKNYFCRHFDKNSAPFGFEYRTRKLDSSAFYIMGDSLKRVNSINPSTYVKIKKLNDGNQIMVWGSNNCFVWGKDSIVLCNNGMIGVVRKIKVKDSLYRIETNNSITSIEISSDGDYTVAGTKDSGWYFIPTLNPENYIKVRAFDKSNEITGFYFDEKKKLVWVQEGEKWGKEFKALIQYDYSNGFLKLVKSFSEDDFGMKSNEAVFAFDFEHSLVFIKSIINKLIVFDLKTSNVKHDFFWDLQNLSLSVIYQIYFNKSDNSLYISAGKYDSTGINLTNFLYKVDKDTLEFSNIVTPKNIDSRDTLYQVGMQTALNKMPASGYSTDSKVTLTNNDLALIPYDKTEFMLYNIRSGNLIKSFHSKNIDLNIESKFREVNTAQISPDGKTIFEYMIKAGTTNGIADTLIITIINVESGVIKKNKLILSAKRDEEISSFFWDEKCRPSFTIKSTGVYPIKIIKSIYLDSLGLPQTLAEYSFTNNFVFSQAWYISKTKNFLLETFDGSNTNRVFNYLLVNASTGESKVLQSGPKSVDILQNASGFLFRSSLENKEILHWYNLNGSLEHRTELSTLNYRIQDLEYFSSLLYLTELKTDKVCRLNLISGEITVLKSSSKPGYNFKVSPDGKLLVSVSDEIHTWQIDNESLHKLYQLKSEIDFITNTQFTKKHLVSDDRVWNLENGLLIQAGMASLAEISDSLLIQSVFPYEILDDIGWDNSFNKQYQLKSHKNVFSKSIDNTKNLADWRDNFKGVILVTKNFNTKSIHSIYELPIEKEISERLKIYPMHNQETALIVKSEYDYKNDLMKSPADILMLLNLENGECKNKLSGKIVGLKQMPLDGSYLFYLLNQKTGMFQLYKAENGEFTKISTIEKFTIDSLKYLNLADENTLVYGTNDGVEFRDLQSGKREQIRFRYLSGTRSYGSDMHYDTEAKALYIGYEDGGILKIVDKKVVECIRSMPSVQKFVGIQGKYLLALDKLGNYYFINKNTLEADLTLFTWKGNSYSDRKYMWLTKENYYTATPGVENNIHFVKNNKIIPLKQGDLIFNRPGKVLEYFEAPKNEIDFYNELYQIRQKKHKGAYKEDVINQNKILLKVESILTEKNAVLTIDAHSQNKITKLNIVVNGCPVNVDSNIEPTSLHLNKTIEIPINSGSNSIYTWVEDEKGGRSMFDERKILGEFKDSGKWYFIGIGVSKYKDTSMNLKYADKDIRDIAKFLGKTYPGIIIDTLLNEEATSANIQKIAAKLKSTKADDKILISFSGHGLLDTSKRFWYATYNLDFDKPNKNGFSMGSISAILENIPARYRLITIDACHSGDVVNGISTASKPVVVNEPIDEYKGVKGAKLLVLKRGNQSSAILLKSMQMVFTDQLSNTGINLIAASSGTEYALEGKNWNNGVFTYALINGWSYGARENSSYSKVHYRNLKYYLQNTVSAVTQGRQTPNTVMENGEIDWWLIPEK